ncbi:MAG: hypothetical protein LC791_08650 [Acidobacteria bacterium]|nr:hypothetical protein [Acidobacteriota bacterium]
MAPVPSPQSATPNGGGLRFGQISELTVIVPLKTGKDGAERLREILAGGTFSGADAVGTVHDMRFVILDNDTKLLFATAYDGDWDSYITDFATKIPDAMDHFFSVVEGWPGIHSSTVKDFIARYQVRATGWYVAYPNETVASIRGALKVRDALNVLFNAASTGL